MSRWRFPYIAIRATAMAVLILQLFSNPLVAQRDARDLEARLPAAEGRERLEILVELTTAYRRDDPARAAERGEEALQLLRTTADEALELELTNSLAYALNRRADYQGALEHAVRAERLARTANKKAELASALGNLGVRDNGSGIDSRYHESIFGLFDRLDQSVPGTGVGLALVERIIEVHGGRVWVQSEGEGRGSTFCFTLPTGSDAGDRRQTPASDTEGPI